jgi:protein SCO1
MSRQSQRQHPLDMYPSQVKRAAMKSNFKIRRTMTVILAAVALFAVAASAQIVGPPDFKHVKPPELQNVGIDQRLNEQVPLDLEFKDEQGNTVKLGDYFHEGRPVVLNLVYYQCPMLCGEVLQGLSAAAKVLKFTPGKEYEIVTLSIDPREKSPLAAEKKASYMKRLGRPEAAAGWHFLVGEKPQIDQLANSIGWRYQYDPKSDQFAHAAGIVLVTPKGRIAQYYYGVEYSARDMRLGIIEASQNKIGSLADEVLLYCYHYDPRTGKYGPIITNIVRLGGVLTIVVLGGFLAVMFRREGARAKSASVNDQGQGRA